MGLAFFSRRNRFPSSGIIYVLMDDQNLKTKLLFYDGPVTDLERSPQYLSSDYCEYPCRQVAFKDTIDDATMFGYSSIDSYYYCDRFWERSDLTLDLFFAAYVPKQSSWFSYSLVGLSLDFVRQVPKEEDSKENDSEGDDDLEHFVSESNMEFAKELIGAYSQGGCE